MRRLTRGVSHASRALGSVRELPGAAEACGDPPRHLSPFQLQRYHLTQESYAQRAAQQARPALRCAARRMRARRRLADRHSPPAAQLAAREACLAALRDPALSAAEKHDTEARYRLTWGARCGP